MSADVGTDDTFRNLGGTSLAVFRVVGRLKARGVDVRGTDLLNHLSITDCAMRAHALSLEPPPPPPRRWVQPFQ